MKKEMRKKNKQSVSHEEKSKESQKIVGNSLGASGFTLSIVGLFSLGVFGAIASFIGFIFCFIQQRNKKTKLGKAGMIINIIAFVLSVLWIFVIYPVIYKSLGY
ncbi:hypothetical protein GYA25_01035 [Candidatus Woesearchaeota archaeon]|jgi:uncharacterized membrane protein|nr:hypothetical protein [Candidatus Woesearchaeota archaeon]